jgi:hypothetical protein
MKPLENRDRNEFFAREFHGEDYWKQCKLQLDQLYANRKKLKGKPTPEQSLELLLDAMFIRHYEAICFHSGYDSLNEDCVCVQCKSPYPNFSEKMDSLLSQF